MSEVEQLVAPTDERPITPAALNKALTVGTEAEAADLVDQSYEWLTGNTLGGRPLARADFSETLHNAEFDKDLRLSRWPVERVGVTADTIQVNHGADALDPDQYVVTNQCRSVLHREMDVDSNLFHLHGHHSIFNPNPRPGVARHFSVPNFTAGYLMPGQLETWADDVLFGVGASTSYDSGTEFGWARATDRVVPFRFEVTAVGTQVLGGSEPIWPTLVGEEVISDGVTYVARYAVEVKPIYATALTLIAEHLDRANNRGKKCDEDALLPARIQAMIGGAC